jgi:hypothetical protein
MNNLFCSITPDTARQILDEIADDLGKDIHVRQRMGQASPSVWPGSIISGKRLTQKISPAET